VLVFNLTNRFLDLEPVTACLAEDAGLVCQIRSDLNVSLQEKRAGKQPSIWAIMAEHEIDLGVLASDSRWRSPMPRAAATVWTDDYSDLASYLILTRAQRWRREARGRPRMQSAVRDPT
jgi:hypothetical protein